MDGHHRPRALALALKSGNLRTRNFFLEAWDRLRTETWKEPEETAKLFLLLRGVPVRTLSESQIEELRDAFKLDL